MLITGNVKNSVGLLSRNFILYAGGTIDVSQWTLVGDWRELISFEDTSVCLLARIIGIDLTWSPIIPLETTEKWIRCSVKNNEDQMLVELPFSTLQPLFSKRRHKQDLIESEISKHQVLLSPIGGANFKYCDLLDTYVNTAMLQQPAFGPTRNLLNQWVSLN